MLRLDRLSKDFREAGAFNELTLTPSGKKNSKRRKIFRWKVHSRYFGVPVRGHQKE